MRNRGQREIKDKRDTTTIGSPAQPKETGGKTMANNWKVRPLTAGDAEAICEICSEDLGYPCTVELVKSKIAGLDSAREAVFVALSDDKCIGYIHVEKYDTLYFETMANILGIAVRKNCQAGGAGTALLQAAEGWAKDRGITLMRVISGATRTGAHAFYESRGYVFGKMQKNFSKRLS